MKLSKGDLEMAKMYYVCNHVDKVEVQFASLEAAKVGYDYAVDEMVKKVLHMFPGNWKEQDGMREAARDLYYIRQVDYVREEIVYEATDLEGVNENE